jgi:hypothetical protein
MFVPFFRPFDNIEPSSVRLLGLKSSGAMRLQAKNTLANNAVEAYQNACRGTLQNIGRLDVPLGPNARHRVLGRIDASVDQIQARALICR